MKALTLIELLIIVAIALIAVALLFSLLRTRTDVNMLWGATKVKVNQMATAFRAYNNEYGKWPSYPTSNIVTNGCSWASILQGKDSNNNPRNIVFIEFKPQEWIQNSVTNIYDSWGQPFIFGFDTNNDNHIDIVNTNANNPWPKGAPTNAS